MVVEVCDTVHGIDNEQDFISLLDSHSHLLVDFLFKNIVGIYHPSTGIYNREFPTAPVYFAILAVAGCSRRRVDDGLTSLRQAVEKSRFTHIGPTYDCYELCHVVILIFPCKVKLKSRIAQIPGLIGLVTRKAATMIFNRGIRSTSPRNVSVILYSRMP